MQHFTKPMSILNSKDILPTDFYIFVNMQNVVTKHNIDNTKSIFSGAFGQLSLGDDFSTKYLEGTVDYLPFVPNKDSDASMISMFNNNITSEYRTEYNCELHRKFNNPKYPSRLSACYAFGDYETCVEVSKKHNWNLSTVRKFTLLPSLYNRVVKVNMEIVSLERTANRISMTSQQTQNSIWSSYWNGIGNIKLELPTVDGRKEFNSGVIWEYLIEGRLELNE